MHWRIARVIAHGCAVVALGWAGIAQAQDITLEEALKRAGAGAPVVDAARADIDAARGDARQAGLGPNPEISLNAENIGGTGPYRGTGLTETTLSASQRIELGGKRGARLRAANADTKVAELRSDLALAQLGADVRQRYAEAVGAVLRLQLALDVVDRTRELARIARELVDAGREPPLRALRAEAALGESEASLREAEANDLSARLALAVLWGSQTPPIGVLPVWPTPQITTVDVAPSDTLAVRLADAEAVAAGLITTRERANAVPDMSLSAGIRRFEETGDRAFVAGASISLPLGNRNQGAIVAAEARTRAAEFRRTAAVAEAYRALGSARIDRDAAVRRVETLEQRSVPQAEEALRLAQIGYRNGKFTLLDVLDAASARDSARLALIDAQETRARADATLLRLTARPETFQ